MIHVPSRALASIFDGNILSVGSVPNSVVKVAAASLEPGSTPYHVALLAGRFEIYKLRALIASYELAVPSQ